MLENKLFFCYYITNTTVELMNKGWGLVFMHKGGIISASEVLMCCGAF